MPIRCIISHNMFGDMVMTFTGIKHHDAPFWNWYSVCKDDEQPDMWTASTGLVILNDEHTAGSIRRDLIHIPGAAVRLDNLYK